MYGRLNSQLNPDYFTVVDVDNPTELFQRSSECQVVVLDLNDPDYSIEILQKLRKNYTGRIIAFAGHVQKKLLDQAKREGTDYVAVNSEISTSLEKIIQSIISE